MVQRRVERAIDKRWKGFEHRWAHFGFDDEYPEKPLHVSLPALLVQAMRAGNRQLLRRSINSVRSGGNREFLRCIEAVVEGFSALEALAELRKSFAERGPVLGSWWHEYGEML